jgi:ectoine hydroxylase-related dioxygenase (phytanoyl-CoA dioxygenase family)
VPASPSRRISVRFETASLRATSSSGRLLFLGSTHHGAGTNRTADQYRTGLTMGLDSAAVRQEENMYVALSRDVVKSCPEQIQLLE